MMERTTVYLKVSVVLLLAVLWGACSEEEKTCNPVGCAEGVLVTLSNPQSEPGVYTLMVVRDGEAQSCEGTLDPSSGWSDDCGDLDLEVVLGQETVPPEDPRCEETNGEDRPDDLSCAPSQKTTLGLLLLNGIHETLGVTIMRGDVVVADAQLTPNYTSQELGGEGCGVCTSGAATLETLP